jgi:hypothetical protein
MITFTIEAYVGPLPIRFGMIRKDVAEMLGPPLSVHRSVFGREIEERKNLSFAYSNDGLSEAVFSPGVELFFSGTELFHHPNLIGFLRQFDDSPFEWVGFIIFLRLGLCLSGFHDNDESQKAIAVFCRDYYHEYEKDFRPYE